jgi:5-methylcytosine-specific restriction protein A
MVQVCKAATADPARPRLVPVCIDRFRPTGGTGTAGVEGPSRNGLHGSIVSLMPVAKPRLDWEREELVLAGDLVIRNGWRQLVPTDPRVSELSELLRRLPLHPVQDRSPQFRNVNSVVRKTADIATNRPGHDGKPTRGGAPTKRIITELLTQPDYIHQLAESIRESETRGEFTPLTRPVGEEDDESGQEGRLLVRRHVSYERDRKLRQRKLDATRRAGRPIACEVCGFDFGHTYGDRGNGYIECHHVVPLHISGSGRTRLSDLALLCANCHRMVHSRAPWLRLPELQDLMRNAGGRAPHFR